MNNLEKNEILIIFGTETGNAEDLSETAIELATDYDLKGQILDMEDVTTDIIKNVEKLMVICSTWGEGEQPVNAQDLYDAVEELEDNSLDGLNFAVLALGDTAFEFFCESGKEWDNVLEQKGGVRIIDRIDCDTDYDDYAEDWIKESLEKFKDLV